MRIEYKNKFSDILLFNAVHQFLSPVLQGFYLLFFALFLFSGLMDDSASAVAAATTAILWYLGLWLIQFVFNAFYLFSRKNKSVLTTHIVEIQDDAFFEETQFNKSFFYWPGIVKAVSRPGFVAVYVTPHMAHIVPNRAFSSKDQKHQFLALLREKMGAA